MSKTQIALIVTGLVLLVGLILGLTCEIREVPDLKWLSQYKYESKNPNDLLLFKSLLEEKYADQKFVLNKKDSVAFVAGNDNLYVSLGYKISFNKKEKEKFSEFISKGNSAFLCANSFDIISEKIDSNLAKTLTVNQKTLYYSADSSFCFDTDFIAKDSTALCYTNYFRDSSRVISFRHSYFLQDTLSKLEAISYDDEWDIFYCKIKIGEGTIFLHSVPTLFKNYSSIQDYYLPHFNKVFSYIPTPEKVVLDKPKIRFTYDPIERESPIDYVLQTPPLKWAYYLTLGSLISFVMFRSKRKQRIIPTVEKNINTSMEYINTLSELYKAQNQNNKLVLHMRNIFLHNMQKKYFIDTQHDEFSAMLSKKSKIPQKDIDNLMYKFNSAESHDFTDDQLIVLHKQIESFYKKAT